jgi:hypothetical protein
MDYTSFIKRARSLATQSERNQVALMRLLYSVANTPAIWKDHYKSWADLLKAERLCTIHKFVYFSKGLNSNLPVDQLGVDATCLLASYPKAVRNKALKVTLDWATTHKVPPTYQLVAEFVRHQGFAPKTKRPKLSVLRAYIQELQTLCDLHSITYPPAPLGLPSNVLSRFESSYFGYQLLESKGCVSAPLAQRL